MAEKAEVVLEDAFIGGSVDHLICYCRAAGAPQTTMALLTWDTSEARCTYLYMSLYVQRTSHGMAHGLVKNRSMLHLRHMKMSNPGATRAIADGVGLVSFGTMHQPRSDANLKVNEDLIYLHSLTYRALIQLH